MSLGDGGLNLPFEPTDGFELDVECYVTGGIVLRAMTIEVAGQHQPGVIFDHYLADGTRMPPVALICTAPELRALVELVDKSTQAAVSAAIVKNAGLS